MTNVAAVVVTYNRLSLLKECISRLKGQTKSLDSIIVINNGSTDGTDEWLSAQNDLTVFRQDNLGGSGGFYAGIKMAFDKNFDWIWMMDDDAFPEETCLEKMSTYYHAHCEGEEVVLAPIVVEGHTVDHGHRGFVDLDRVSFPLKKLQTTDKTLALSKETKVSLTFASFIGLCMHRRIAEVAGFPAKDYFIYNDDVEYTIRIVKAGFPILLLNNAVIYHKFLPERELVYDSEEESGNNLSRTLSIPFKGKLTQWKTLYSNPDKVPMFQFMGKRNLLRTIIRHKGMTPRLVGIILLEMIDSLVHVAHSKGGKIQLYKLYFQSFKQGISGKYDNAAFYRIVQSKTKRPDAKRI